LLELVTKGDAASKREQGPKKGISDEKKMRVHQNGPATRTTLRLCGAALTAKKNRRQSAVSGEKTRNEEVRNNLKKKMETGG